MIQVPVTAMMEKKGQPGKGVPLVALEILVLRFIAGFKRSSNVLWRLSFIILILVGIGSMFALTGCGGVAAVVAVVAVSRKTYNIIVTAASGSLSHWTTVTLVVQ